MRFGISATSSILPKNLRTRLRPVNVCAIVGLVLRRALCGDGFPTADQAVPRERYRSGQAQCDAPDVGRSLEPAANCRSGCQAPNHILRIICKFSAVTWRFRGVITPESLDFVHDYFNSTLAPTFSRV